MNNVRRIVIMGYSGGGKSTLARTLGEAYGLAVLHLDQVQWLPGWQSRPREEQRLIVGEFLDTHGAWVIDGNYEKICEERRLEEAELIVELLFGPLACYRRARKRLRKYRGMYRIKALLCELRPYNNTFRHCRGNALASAREGRGLPT